MRRLLGVALVLLMAQPVLAAGSSITAGDGPFQQGQTYTNAQLVASWSAKRDNDYWARVQCNQNGQFVLDAFVSLSRPEVQPDLTLASDFWTEGAGSCTILLAAFTKHGSPTYFASDTFEVAP